jgi:hypothetical protein
MQIGSRERSTFVPRADDARPTAADHPPRKPPNQGDPQMRRFLIGLAALAATLTLAGTAAAASSDGAVVVNDSSCSTNIFATTCITVKSTTNSATTPSGNISYVTNGTVERTMTFVFGGTYTFSDELHLHGLRKDGEVHEESDHYYSQWEAVSGTYHLTCVQSYDLHWANGKPQLGDYQLYCV